MVSLSVSPLLHFQRASGGEAKHYPVIPTRARTRQAFLPCYSVKHNELIFRHCISSHPLAQYLHHSIVLIDGDIMPLSHMTTAANDAPWHPFPAANPQKRFPQMQVKADQVPTQTPPPSPRPQDPPKTWGISPLGSLAVWKLPKSCQIPTRDVTNHGT